jgi:hypothetical protein
MYAWPAKAAIPSDSIKKTNAVRRLTGHRELFQAARFTMAEYNEPNHISDPALNPNVGA